MERGSCLLLQPYTSKIPIRSIIPSYSGRQDYRLILLDNCTSGQATFAPGCTVNRLVLRRKKQVHACSSRESSAASVQINKCSVHSNSRQSNGRDWLVQTRLKIPSRSVTDTIKGGNQRWNLEAVAKCLTETGTQVGNLTSKSEEARRLFIFGFGYISYALAVDLRIKNWNVTGTCRSCEVRSELEDGGFHTFLFNSDNDGEELKDSGLQELERATHWLVSIPPVGDFNKDPVLAVHRQELIRAAARGNVSWIGYLSSTGVYGDWQGEWVDEDTEPRPSGPKAVARLAAEEDWLNFGITHGVAVQVFRLGGIYGAGRNAFTTILQNRTRLRPQRERRRFTSRIHVADVCQVLTASMRNPCPGRIYNVVDDHPAPRKEVFAFARDLCGQEVRDTEATEEATIREDVNKNSFLLSHCEEKRVSNRRIKEELLIQLLHPSYKSGLREIWKNSFGTESST